MAQVKVYYDKVGNTLTVWFGDQIDEAICEKTGEEIILMKDKLGNVIGFEKLNYQVAESEKMDFAFETMP
jgi:hypothetical protein